MTPEILQAIQIGGWAVAFAVVGYPLVTKVLTPLVKNWISKRNGGNGMLYDKVEEFENNHLHDMREQLDSHKMEFDEFRKETRKDVSKLKGDVAFIKGKMSK